MSTCPVALATLPDGRTLVLCMLVVPEGKITHDGDHVAHVRRANPQPASAAATESLDRSRAETTESAA